MTFFFLDWVLFVLFANTKSISLEQSLLKVLNYNKGLLSIIYTIVMDWLLKKIIHYWDLQKKNGNNEQDAY